MGSVRPTFIKRVAIELVKIHGDSFTDDFEHNKRMLARLTNVQSPHLRNKIAGYLTSYVKIQARARRS